MLQRAGYGLRARAQAAARPLGWIGWLSACVVGKLVYEIPDAAILHLDLLHFLVLVGVVAVGSILIELALCFSVVSLYGVRLLRAFICLC